MLESTTIAAPRPLSLLPPLQKLTLQPCVPPHSEERSRAMRELRRIERIQILSSTIQYGSRFYVLGVHVKSTARRGSHIPLVRAQQHDCSKRSPEVLVQHRLWDYCRLAEDMRRLGASSALQHVLDGPTSPDLLVKWTAHESKMWHTLHRVMLEQWLHDVLSIVTSGFAGHEFIPVLVFEFIFQSWDSNSPTA
ncbi:hypothetical protein PINS_up022378 [Pythium insidiosum]|nr:hypothetical protein PINS_up006383 [Pythium insidiosum]GLE10277.1 hypothetical protein PINS_up022378 [Pythium insidiosum]